MKAFDLIRAFWRARNRAAFLLLTSKSMRLFEKMGVTLTPIHFYSPVPDRSEVLGRPELFTRRHPLVGIDQNLAVQRENLAMIGRYAAECDFPAGPAADERIYHTANPYFGYASATAMHAFLRHYRPRRVVEVGLGYSTRVIVRALERNGTGASLVGIDPFPVPLIQSGQLPLSRVLASRVEDVPLVVFEELEAGDVLSIDSSHALRIGGDVAFLYLDMLPRLRPGVVVHIHDIFFPFDYPKDFIEARRFWTEQYLLQAFLINNSDFEILWVQRQMEDMFPEDFARAFSGRVSPAENHGSYSFWMRRRPLDAKAAAPTGQP